MKRIILLGVMVCGIIGAFAQTDKFAKENNKIYGTPEEKRDQEAIANKAGYELYRLIGFKEYYVNGISNYMQMHGLNLDDSHYIKGGTEFVFSPRIGMGKPDKTYIRYWVNADKRITKLKITGPFNVLADLFIRYWPTDMQWTSTAQLKRGIVAKKMLIDETISYNSKGLTPFIEISK